MSDTCRRPRMKAVIAGLIVALMMAFALPGAAFAEDTVLTICEQTGKQAATTAATYTSAQLESAADITTQKAYVYQSKKGMNVLCTDKAVTFNTLLSAATSWKDGARLVYFDSATYTKFSPTYAQINATQYFYPSTSTAVDTTGAEAVPAALALETATASLSSSSTAGVVAGTLTTYTAGLRTVMGATSADDIAGNKFYTGPTKITVVTPEDISTGTITMDDAFNIGLGTDSIAPMPTSVTDAEGNALAATTDYKVSYADASGAAVDSISAAGTYTVTVTATASAASPYYTGSISKQITVTSDGIFGRVSGDDRYETANKIATAAYPDGCDTVVITGGWAWPDSLSVAGYAGSKKAAILLTDTAALTDSTRDEIKALGAKNIVIIGGKAAVSSETESDLEALGTVTRIWGNDRYETALNVDNALASTGEYAIIASGVSAADALSASGYAYAEATPIYLADETGMLTDGEAKAINDAKYTKILLVGGNVRISDKIKSQITVSGASYMRFAGADRYDTSDMFARWALGLDTAAAIQPQETMSIERVDIAGGDYITNPNNGADAPRPDALAGSALAGVKKSVIVLTGTASEDNTSILALMTSNKSSIKTMYFLGGTAAISDNAMMQFENAVK